MNPEPASSKGILSKTSSLFSSCRKFAPWFFLALIISAFAWIEIVNFTPAYREIDCEGYLLLAKRISDGGPLAVKDDDIFYYQNHVWVENGKGEVLPKFAPGYPAIMALFYKFGGDVSMFLVSPICGALTLVGAFLLFRLWMSSFAALMATACLAFNRLFLVYAGYLLTHSLDICAVTWGMYFLFSWSRDGRWKHALGSGLILGFACAVRFTEVLLVIVVAMAIMARMTPYLCELKRFFLRKEGMDMKSPGWHPVLSVGILLASYAIFPCILFMYNKVMFGGYLTTGYYFSNEQYAYSWAQLFKVLPDIWAGLSHEGLFLTLEAGIVGMLVLGT